MLLDAAGGPSAIDRGDSEGDTPLHNAARGSHEAVVQVSVRLTGDVSARADAAARTLCVLAQAGCGACQAEVPVELTSLGSTCSSLVLPAAGCPRPPLPLQLLLERGADATLQNDEFKTPAQLAERGTPARQLLEAAQRQAAAAAAAAQPEGPPPAAGVG